MMLTRSRLVGGGLTVAAVTGIGALAYAAIGAGRSLPRLAAERGQGTHVAATAQTGQTAHVGEATLERIAQGEDERVAQRDDKSPPPAKTMPQPRITPPIAKTPLSGTRQDDAGPTKDHPSPPPHDARRDERAPSGGNVRATGPGTNVDVDRDRGKVRVRAPYTKVDVDPDRGQVRVRAPYVNLDIRW